MYSHIAVMFFVACLLPLACSAESTLGRQFERVQFGAADARSGQAIERLNGLLTLRINGNYAKLAIQLQEDRSRFEQNKYAVSRIIYELAELYSVQLFDLENAIELDRMLLSQPIPIADEVGGFVPKVLTSNNQILGDAGYLAAYAGKNADEVAAVAKKRLARNIELVDGKLSRNSGKYTVSFLREHLTNVGLDIANTVAGTRARQMIISRMIRAEYELIFADAKVDLKGPPYLIASDFRLTDIDFSEIDYLRLADYLMAVFKKESDIRFAESALETVYRPYQNLRDSNARWKYNKIINDYISTLIEANFKAGRFDEMLYYASLNKSRMLLEERLTFGGTQGIGKKMSDFVSDDGIPRTAFGLPDKAWFKTRLASSAQYLDFYVGGTYVAEALAAGSKANRAERSVMPLNSRNSSVVRDDEPADTFVDDSLYLTQVNAGRVTAVKLVGPQLTELRREMEKSYESISNTKAAFASPAFQKLKTSLQITGDLTVSPDKWVATHPLDFHLQSKVVRSVNFFTSGATRKLDGIRVAGFFNPTLDLAGADREADAIKALIPSAEIVRRETARKSALKDVASANVIHLSMHGYFNAADPTLSKLLFAGSAVDASSTDPSAMYAVEMSAIPALRNRDLVFAAACQTGLLAADRTNSSEMTGILRPLTANRNKNIILSLWNVSDQATGEFVRAFYQRLAATQDVKVSFHYAQDQLRAKYPHPYYWAAFYLSQAN